MGNRESGISVGAQCLRPRESGIGSRESGIGSRESGIGSRESGIGNPGTLPPVPCSLFPKIKEFWLFTSHYSPAPLLPCSLAPPPPFPKSQNVP
ncbi:hypothetical protein [Spirulina subsalsa]|uniref:hypothetical protein n=1 Tax=Spirulina subsalsa TaxID=54311 RepID=UPI0002F5C5C8|nr:hypothetical protein [Spirulina subsalsa]